MDINIENSTEKTSYFLITENENAGVFICISELDILNRNEIVKNIIFTKYIEKDEKAFIYVFSNKGVVLDIEIMDEEKEILKSAIEEKEAAFIVMSIENKILLDLDIE